MAGKPDVWISTGSELQTGQKSHEIPPIKRWFQGMFCFKHVEILGKYHHIHSSTFCWFQNMFCVFHLVICVGFSYFEEVSHWGCWTKTEGRSWMSEGIRLMLCQWYLPSFVVVQTAPSRKEACLYQRWILHQRGPLTAQQKSNISPFRCSFARGFTGKLFLKWPYFRWIPELPLLIVDYLTILQQTSDCFSVWFN